MGRTLFDIAFLIYASKFENAKLAVSIVSIITTLPYATDFILGYMADKEDKKVSRLIHNKVLQTILFLAFSIIVFFKSSWYVFFAIVLINVVADVFGGYNSYLSLSIYYKIVEEKDLEKAFAFNNSISTTVSLVSKFMGVMIIEVIAYNYSVFGIINSSLYFVSFLLMYINRSRLKSVKFNIENKEKITAKRFLKDTIENLKIIRSNKKIYRFVLLFAILNLYSSGMYAIFLLVILDTPNLLVGNYANTLTVTQALETIFMIVAGVYIIPIYRKVDIVRMTFIEIIFFILYVLNILFLQNVYALLILVSISGYLAGVSNPKLTTFLLKEVPEDKQTSIFSIYGTIVTLTVPLGTIIFTFLSNVIGNMFTISILLAVLVFSLLYTYTFILNEKQKYSPKIWENIFLKLYNFKIFRI